MASLLGNLVSCFFWSSIIHISSRCPPLKACSSTLSISSLKVNSKAYVNTRMHTHTHTHTLTHWPCPPIDFTHRQNTRATSIIFIVSMRLRETKRRKRRRDKCSRWEWIHKTKSSQLKRYYKDAVNEWMSEWVSEWVSECVIHRTSSQSHIRCGYCFMFLHFWVNPVVLTAS